MGKVPRPHTGSVTSAATSGEQLDHWLATWITYEGSRVYMWGLYLAIGGILFFPSPSLKYSYWWHLCPNCNHLHYPTVCARLLGV